MFSNRRIDLALAMAMVNSGLQTIAEGQMGQQQIGELALARMKYAYKNAGGRKSSGAARAKRIARKRRNIRARGAK